MKAFTIAAACALALSVAACGQNQNSAEEAGERIDSANEILQQGSENLGDGPAENAGEAVDRAAGEALERAEEAGDAIERETDEAKREGAAAPAPAPAPQ